MIVLKTAMDVRGVSGQDLSDFMLNCTDEDYQQWWGGTHLAFHTIERYPDEIGNLVYFDEYVGKRRLKFMGVITEYVPGKKIVWQMKKVVRLPGWLALEFEDGEEGVRIIHSLAVGFGGLGKVLDPILRIYLSDRFEKELEEHAHTEFRRLADMLS